MKFQLSILLLICFLCAVSRVAAQDNMVFKPIDDNTSFKEAQLAALLQRYNADIASLSGSNKKDISSIYKDRYETLKGYFDDSLVITGKEMNDYLLSVVNEVEKNNPALQNLHASVFFCRAWWPNASCYGEGTVLLNIGLLNRLHNEAELAFVICHELAHQYFNHGNNAINRYVETLNSKEFQQQLKAIKNAEFEKRTQLEKLIQSVSFSGRRHSREYESQADSMAVVWLSNSSYNPAAALDCLALLDTADRDKYDISANPQLFFNFPEYPFQQAWIQNGDSFFSKMAHIEKEENKEIDDSLKTHPDCLKRIALLQNNFINMRKVGATFLVYDSARWKELQNGFDYEIMDYTFHHNNISRSLYYTLQMLQYGASNAWLVSNAGRCLNMLYQSQKTHLLGRVIDTPSAANEIKYNNFLQFIWAVRLNDIAAFSYYYMRKESRDFGTDSIFLQTFTESRKIFNN